MAVKSVFTSNIIVGNLLESNDAGPGEWFGKFEAFIRNIVFYRSSGKEMIITGKRTRDNIKPLPYVLIKGVSMNILSFAYGSYDSGTGGAISCVPTTKCLHLYLVSSIVAQSA